MSLQYIIDGYNITSHTTFTRNINKKIKDQRKALLSLIRASRLTGSLKNEVTVVFDGYPPARDDEFRLNKESQGINVLFSRDESADDRIKKLIARCENPKTTVVVSDDKEIVFFAKAHGAKTKSVEEFISPKRVSLKATEELLDAELSYSQMHRINEELRKLWLK